MRMRKLKKRIKIRIEGVALATLIFVFAVVAGMLDYPDHVADEEGYCAMVRLYQSSGGKAGWPAYRGECNLSKN